MRIASGLAAARGDPVFVVACIRGPRFAFPPVVAASLYGSIFPAVQNLLLSAFSARLGRQRYGGRFPEFRALLEETRVVFEPILLVLELLFVFRRVLAKLLREFRIVAELDAQTLGGGAAALRERVRGCAAVDAGPGGCRFIARWRA